VPVLTFPRFRGHLASATAGPSHRPEAPSAAGRPRHKYRREWRGPGRPARGAPSKSNAVQPGPDTRTAAVDLSTGVDVHRMKAVCTFLNQFCPITKGGTLWAWTGCCARSSSGGARSWSSTRDRFPRSTWIPSPNGADAAGTTVAIDTAYATDPAWGAAGDRVRGATAEAADPYRPVELSRPPCPDNQQRLFAPGRQLGQRRVGRLVGQILLAGKEPHERPASVCLVIANGAAQHRMAGLQGVQDGAQRDRGRDIQQHLAVDVGEAAQMGRELDSYLAHRNVCTSTDSTGGKSRTMAVQLSPPSGEA
jgi:hypothetical protein